jgi:2-polyprenyl-3-methyl-5-hydroxy-6-metoxy-1,4-benzoquinol methylase
VNKYHSYFEEFIPSRSYDTIIMSHVLEHIEYPVEVLSKVKEWVSDDGVVIISVPNAQSLHRKAAVHIGLLGSVYELNERDHQLGHYRVYDLESLVKDVLKAGFYVTHSGGIFLKPLSNGQIQENWNDSMIDAFYKLGKELPQNCAEIYVILKK